MSRVVLLTTHPGAVARLLPVFAEAGLEIVAVGPRGSYLRQSRHLSRYVGVADDAHAWSRTYRWLVDVLLRHDDWVVCGSDDVIWSIVDSDLTAEEKVRLLPVARVEALSALDSKVGMAAAFRKAGICHPDFLVAENAGALAVAGEEIGGEVMVKNGRSGGGAGVRMLTSLGSEDLARLGSGPHLVERFHEGVLTSVDGLFEGGSLSAASYSEILGSIGATGVSYRRRFAPLPSGALPADLERLGGLLGLDGFANISAIRTPDGRHVIFEVDPRPNTWHAYAPRLGVDLVAAIRGRRSGGPAARARPQLMSSDPVIVGNVSRTLHWAARPAGLPSAWRLAHPRETLRFVNTGDPALLPGELIQFGRWAVLHVRQGMRGMVARRWRRAKT